MDKGSGCGFSLLQVDSMLSVLQRLNPELDQDPKKIVKGIQALDVVSSLRPFKEMKAVTMVRSAEGWNRSTVSAIFGSPDC